MILFFLLNFVLHSSSAFTFTDSSIIKTFPDLIYGFKLKNNYLWTSASSYGYVDKYDGYTLENIWKTPSFSYGSYDMEMDVMKNWFFTAPYTSSNWPISFYQY
jgi:hypothetical protein